MVDFAGEQCVFCINATFMVASDVYNVYFVPETEVSFFIAVWNCNESHKLCINIKQPKMISNAKSLLLSNTWPQWIAAIQVFMLATITDFMYGWSSPYLALLTSDGSPLPITAVEASWVAALINLGRAFGAITGGVCMEFFGSKTTLLIAGVPPILGWTCAIVANSVWWLYAARMLVGLSLGMIFASFPMYLGEISDPSIRGALVGLVLIGFSMGIVIGNIMGAYVSMAVFSYISLVPSVLYLVSFILMPQSPHYLVRISKLEQAKKSIEWYHPNENSKAELETVVNFVNQSAKQSLVERFKEMNQPKNRKAFIMTIILFLYMQLCGLNSILFYMEIILTNGKLTVIEPSTLVILVNALPIFLGILTMYAIDKIGKKLLLCVSSGGAALSMGLMGMHFMLLKLGYNSENLQWLLILSMFLFDSIYLGVIQIPSAILGEIFPANLKPVAGFVGSVFAAIFAFVSSKTYQPAVDLIGEEYVFWLIALIMLTCVVYSVNKLPETKGKTLQEIQDML